MTGRERLAGSNWQAATARLELADRNWQAGTCRQHLAGIVWQALIGRHQLAGRDRQRKAVNDRHQLVGSDWLASTSRQAETGRKRLGKRAGQLKVSGRIDRLKHCNLHPILDLSDKLLVWIFSAHRVLN